MVLLQAAEEEHRFGDRVRVPGAGRLLPPLARVLLVAQLLLHGGEVDHRHWRHVWVFGADRLDQPPAGIFVMAQVALQDAEISQGPRRRLRVPRLGRLLPPPARVLLVALFLLQAAEVDHRPRCRVRVVGADCLLPPLARLLLVALLGLKVTKGNHRLRRCRRIAGSRGFGIPAARGRDVAVLAERCGDRQHNPGGDRGNTRRVKQLPGVPVVTAAAGAKPDGTTLRASEDLDQVVPQALRDRPARWLFRAVGYHRQQRVRAQVSRSTGIHLIQKPRAVARSRSQELCDCPLKSAA